jgi:XRE family transcriptional regulator, aerobic/anaerobic benzoate catabolism transcriptional regulator
MRFAIVMCIIFQIALMPDTITLPPQAELEKATSDSRFLTTLGQRVRAWRARRGMTRKMLASHSQVSERHLAQLESGKGNISILLLQQIAGALNITLTSLFQEENPLQAELQVINQVLRRLPEADVTELRKRLVHQYGKAERDRRQHIALIGLRGGGKSTLGARLAKELNWPLVELDREVERLAGMGLSELFSLYGQSGYRRFERRALETAIDSNDRVVIATGGSIVTESATFDLLLSACYTVWLKAKPEDHMNRVVAQGDMRPMAGNKAAMDDLRQILTGRTALYGKADATIDTSELSLQQSLRQLKQIAT